MKISSNTIENREVTSDESKLNLQRHSIKVLTEEELRGPLIGDFPNLGDFYGDEVVDEGCSTLKTAGLTFVIVI